jgi:putative N6-adenine-specific DNA methylase
MVLLSRWDPSRPFADPLCGSGTIPIEAAMIAWNIAPGISRSFAAESWPHVPAAAWREARQEARAAERRDLSVRIAGSDEDARIVSTARRNAEKAGVADAVSFEAARLEDFRPAGEYGCMVSNPPYGERIGGEREVEGLYKAMGRLFRELGTWSLFALSAHPGFPELFGSPASRNRKLYNGNIRCYYYQYFGPLSAGEGASGHGVPPVQGD